MGIGEKTLFPTPHSPLPTPHILLLHKLQRGRSDAVAQSGRLRPVVEDVTEMGVAAAAQDFDAAHAVAVIGFGRDVLFRSRLPEAGPASARIEFCLRVEEF